MAIGTPNCTRCLEHSVANSSAARAMPVAMAATPGRVRSSVIIASLKPLFSSPIRLSRGAPGSSNGGGAGRHGRRAGARAVERHHRELEALVLLADQVLGGDLGLVERDGRGVGG